MLQPREFPETRPSLLDALRVGDPNQSAWRDFFERYAPAVFRVARLRGLDDADADDVVQQSMLAVAKHIQGFRYNRDRGRFRQWLRRIAESKIADLHRRRKPVPARNLELLSERLDQQPSLDDIWEQQWRLQDLLWCLDQVALDISPRRIEAFKLYVLEGRPASEIAERLGMTEGYVYVTRYHVLQRIRERIAELDAEEHGK